MIVVTIIQSNSTHKTKNILKDTKYTMEQSSVRCFSQRHNGLRFNRTRFQPRTHTHKRLAVLVACFQINRWPAVSHISGQYFNPRLFQLSYFLELRLLKLHLFLTCPGDSFLDRRASGHDSPHFWYFYTLFSAEGGGMMFSQCNRTHNSEQHGVIQTNSHTNRFWRRATTREMTRQPWLPERSIASYGWRWHTPPVFLSLTPPLPQGCRKVVGLISFVRQVLVEGKSGTRLFVGHTTCRHVVFANVRQFSLTAITFRVCQKIFRKTHIFT